MIRLALAALLAVAAAIGCRRVVEFSPSQDAAQQDALVPPDAGISFDGFDDEDGDVNAVFDSTLPPG